MSTRRNRGEYGRAAGDFLQGGVPGLLKGFAGQIFRGNHAAVFPGPTREVTLSFWQAATDRTHRTQHVELRKYRNIYEDFAASDYWGAPQAGNITPAFYPVSGAPVPGAFLFPQRRRRRRRKRHVIRR